MLVWLDADRAVVHFADLADLHAVKRLQAIVRQGSHSSDDLTEGRRDGLFWDLMQQNAIDQQRDVAATLDQRVPGSSGS